jgi:hypothetical protein
MSVFITGISLFDQKKYVEAFYELQSCLLLSDTKLQDKKIAHEKLIFISRKVLKNELNEKILNYANFLKTESKEIAKALELLESESLFSNESTIKLKIELSNMSGNIEKSSMYNFELIDYYFMKRLYQKNREHLSDLIIKHNNQINYHVFNLINEFYIFDKKQIIINFERLNENIIRSKVEKNRIDYVLIYSELLCNVGPFEGVDGEVYIIILEINLKKLFEECLKGKRINKIDINKMIEVLVCNPSIDNFINHSKILYLNSYISMAFSFLKILEKDKSFNYLKSVKQDKLLKRMFVEFRSNELKSQEVVPESIIGNTTHFEFNYKKQNSKNITENITKIKNDLLAELKKYNVDKPKSDESVINDLKNQIKFGKFNEVIELDDYVMTFNFLNLYEVSLALIEKYKDRISSYLVGSTFYLKKDYVECINKCQLMINKKHPLKEDAHFYMLIGKSYSKLKNEEKSKKAMSQAKLLDPDYEFVGEFI